MKKIATTRFFGFFICCLFYLIFPLIALPQCSDALKPTFGYNFNGQNVFNTNNGSPDPGESATVTLCDGGQYLETAHFHSSSSTLYNLMVVPAGGGILFNGYVPANAVITAAEFTALEGRVTVKLTNPGIGGTLVQTITPFTDLNNNGILDQDDCDGDPIVLYYAVSPNQKWFKDFDGDQHAAETRLTCVNPGKGWTLTPLPVDDCNDNNPAPCPKSPVVRLTSPASGTNYVVKFPVVLSAEATQEGGSIRSVDFYAGNTLIFTEYKAPYMRKWYPAVTGSYYITAVATGIRGIKTVSAPVHITILHNRPPAVNIAIPADHASFTSPANIDFSATATAHGGKIKTVDFYNGTTLIHTEKKFPYFWTWKNVTTGSYTITASATDTYGRTTISAPVHISVLNKCPVESQPTFGFDFNGKKIFNINNGAPDASERVNITLCNHAEYTESNRFHSSSTNLYQVTYVSSGGSIYFNGVLVADVVLSAEQYDFLVGPVKVELADPTVGGSVLQTIVPFTDVNNNGVLDGADCSGDPVILSYEVTPCAVTQCEPASQPTFGFKLNDTAKFNINNGSRDESEFASISLFDHGVYYESDRFHSSSTNLYNVTFVKEGGTIFFNGVVTADAVINTFLYNSFVGPVSVELADPQVGGTVLETITPFTDLNDNGTLDSADCAGDPVVIFYKVDPRTNATCPFGSQPVFGFNFNGTDVGNINNGSGDPGEAAAINVCDGAQYTTSAHFHSSLSTLYDIKEVPTGGVLLFNGFVVSDVVLPALQLSATAGKYTISLADPGVSGTLTQTITPFTDLNNNGSLDADDCAGDPVIFTYSAAPCSGIRPAAVSRAGVRGNKMENNNLERINIFPNPATNTLMISTNGLQMDMQSSISVVSSTGVELKSMRTNGSSKQARINIASLASGTYFIRIVSGGKVMYSQFVKM